jgi:hypothetical protein
MTSMSRSIFLLVFAALLILAPVAGSARIGVVVGLAPPVPVVEPVPPPPAPGYVWQPGYWSWNGVQYVWVPGAMSLPLLFTRRGCPEDGSGSITAGGG